MQERCDCRIIHANRVEIKQLLTGHDIIKITAPFGLHDDITARDILTKPDRIDDVRGRNIRTNNKIHMKIAIAREWAAHGSCNFTRNSIENRHETMHVIPRDTHTHQYNRLDNIFHDIWERSTEV